MFVRKCKLLLKSRLPSPKLKSYGTYIRKNISFLKSYRYIKLSDEDIVRGDYKNFFGGGPLNWDTRGRFQLFFLESEGLSPESKLIDIGCGPIRGGIHFINFLKEGNYFGIDYNKSFIQAARMIVKDQGLQEKKPKLEVVSSFNLPNAEKVFDYGIAFSVLNHCNERERRNFFEMMLSVMKIGGLFYVSHAKWFNESYLTGTHCRVVKSFEHSSFDITKFGWEHFEAVFPILKLEICQH
jgi:SAM-dependent methyltransferase